MRTELWLTEGIRLQAVCRDPAELLEALVRRGISAADVREDGERRYSFWVRGRDASQAIRTGSQLGAEVTVLQRRGFLHFLRRFRRRAYLLLIPLPFLCWFAFQSTRLWSFDVEGNRTVTRAEILSALEASGVRPGVSGLRLDNTRIRNCMLEQLDRLIWCTVRVRGSRCVVIVRERRKPPEILDETLHREVIAARTGTIDRLNVLEGKALVRRGDTVEAGEPLISGKLTDRQSGTRLVHAFGKAMAFTWYEKTMELPNAALEKLPTGESTRKTALILGDLRLNFYNESSISYGCYDRIQTEKSLMLFGLELPVRLVRAEYRECRISEIPVEPGEAERILEDRLLEWLKRTAPEALLLEPHFSAEVTDRSVRVTMLAQCLEDIAAERAIEP